MYKDIEYTGIDITFKLVEYNKRRNINCLHGSLNDIPFKNNSLDIVHSRHVVEHMNSIDKLLTEMIRVASQKVFISFFFKLTNESTHYISLDNKRTIGEVYHNIYSKILIDQNLNNCTKVKDIRWIELPRPSY